MNIFIKIKNILNRKDNSIGVSKMNNYDNDKNMTVTDNTDNADNKAVVLPVNVIPGDKDMKPVNITTDEESVQNVTAKETNEHSHRSYYENRELSWLKFNERVLEEASDSKVPMCERLTFASIFQSNLDEFYMVRVGSLYDQMLLAKSNKKDKNAGRDNKTGMSAAEQLTAIFQATRGLLHKKDKIYTQLMYAFEEQGVKLISFNDVEYADAVYLEEYFNNSILPLLSPQVVGKKNPFPFLKNKEIYAVALLGAKNNDKVGIVQCSGEVFDRLIPIPSDKNKYMLVEELILHFLPVIFKKYNIKSKSLIRIIRNADIDVDEAFYDEDLDYRDTMEKLVKERRKLCPVKLEYTRVLDEKVITSLCKELKLDKEQVFYSESPLELSFISRIQDDLRSKKELFFARRVPQNSAMLNEYEPVMPQIRNKDILLSYPYESMNPLINLLREAGHDKNVVSIKMTLYRVAKNSQIVDALINAAENGKEVVVLVELRARFDEENNIEWSRRLEDAGCRIIYGIDHMKVHSKLCLITYKSGDGVEHITHIGTGNFNEKTAKLYTDLALFTANEAIAGEAALVFNSLCMEEVVDRTEHLLVAPKCLQNKILGFIDDEIAKVKEGHEGYIGVKINSLTDKTIIDKLVEASQAGVKIDMVIRGISCLVAGIEGYSDNITITSIVGRYLEHSRIYIFGTADRDRIFISSADFMTRNTLRRVEIAAPVYDENLKMRIRNMFDIMKKDNVKARVMRNDGKYYKKSVSEGEELINSQEYFYDEAYKAVDKQK